jgi:hypothetical protein
LRHPELVPGRVTEAGVDAVGLLRRLLRELDAAALQVFVARLDVVRREEKPAGGAFGQQRLDLLARVLVEDGRAGTAMSVMATSGWPGTPTLSQRKFPISGTVTSSRSSIPSFSV